MQGGGDLGDEKKKEVSKVMLFEDIDIVFNDEGEFYGQLSKLLLLTKIPVIMTATNASFISSNLLPLLKKSYQQSQLEFEMIKYSCIRPTRADLFALSFLINLFEAPIASSLKRPDQFLRLSPAQVDKFCQLSVCSEQIMRTTCERVSAILHDGTRKGLAAILNSI